MLVEEGRVREMVSPERSLTKIWMLSSAFSDMERMEASEDERESIVTVVGRAVVRREWRGKGASDGHDKRSATMARIGAGEGWTEEMLESRTEDMQSSGVPGPREDGRVARIGTRRKRWKEDAGGKMLGTIRVMRR
jgi:hypothetical protein